MPSPAPLFSHSPSTHRDSRTAKNMKSLRPTPAPLCAPPLSKLFSSPYSSFLKDKVWSSELMAPLPRLTIPAKCVCRVKASPGALRHALLCAACCRGLIFSTASASITTRILKPISRPCCACASICSACMSTRKTIPARWLSLTYPLTLPAAAIARRSKIHR